MARYSYLLDKLQSSQLVPRQYPASKLDVNLAIAPFLKTCETVLEFLGGLKLCLDVLLCFFLLITLLELIAE